MEDSLLVSVIVPVYNLEKYLERCVQSILVQTYKNLEVILVDDGSIDQSKIIIEQLAQQDNRVKAVFKKNGGVTSARLVGIKKAQGTFIGFVDGDDEIEADMYELLVNNARKYQADISHCGYQMQFADGRINYFYNTGKIHIQDNITGLKDLLEGDFVEPGLCNKLYHRRLFENLLNNSLMDYSIKINEDLLMNYYLFKEAKKSVFQDVCKYYYKIREMSASRQPMTINKIEDPIKVRKVIVQDCPESIKDCAKKVYLRTCIYTYCALVADNESLYKKKMILLREKIIKGKKYSALLGRRVQLLYCGIVLCPHGFGFLYRKYLNLGINKKYS